MPANDDGSVSELREVTLEEWEKIKTRGGPVLARKYFTTVQTESRPGNMFAASKLRGDLAAVRAAIARAVLIAHGRRRLAASESTPDLVFLRRWEAELIVRLDLLDMITPDGDVRPGP